MRWSWLLSLLWAQSVCVWVEPPYLELRHQLRGGRLSERMRQAALWRGFVRSEPLSPDTAEVALGGWFVLHFQGEDSVALLGRLRASGSFRVVEPLRGRRICGNLYGWHHHAIQTAQAWARTYGSPRIPIAILDTGIDTALSAFRGQYHINLAEDLNRNRQLDPGDLNGIDDDGNGFTDDVMGYDFTDQARLLTLGDAWGADPLPLDENGHGTAMASVIAAGQGSTLVRGIAPGCPILIVRAFSADGYGEDDDIVRGILYAVQRGVRVISCSFGDEVPSQMMAAAIRYAVGQGVVVVASSGNGTGGRPHYPSGLSEVMAVGAASFDPESGRYFLWPLSGYARVDWVAPGDQVPVLVPGGAVRSLSGTSIAAAITSAAVALLLSRYPALSPDEVRATFVSSALDLGNPGWDIYTGAGLLRLSDALDYPQSGVLQWLSPLCNSRYGTGTLPLRVRIYHSLLAYWELTWANSLQGPWQGNLRASIPVWDTTLSWTPPGPGTWYLRLTAHLRNRNALTALCRIQIDPAPLSFKETRIAPTWQQNLLGYAATYALSTPLPVCLTHTGGKTCIDRIDSAGAAWLGPLSLPAVAFQLCAAQETLSMSLTAPSLIPTALGTDNHLLSSLTAPPGFYWPESLPDWNSDGLPDLAATLYNKSGTYHNLAFLSPASTGYRSYDSIPRTALIRDIDDWDGDGNHELLAVWYDSFFVYGGSPPKNLLFSGKGLAAKLEYGRTIWVRTQAGHYEQQSTAGEMQRRLLDTTSWRGSTTIPRLLKLRWGRDSVWVFGNYAGFLFAYQGERLIGVYETGLEEVGSFIQAVDVDGDGRDELIYLGRHPSRRVWRLGLLRVGPWQEVASIQFWAEGTLRPRLFVGSDGRILLWLPPQVYFGRVTSAGFVWEAYGPWAWDACAPVASGWLLGIDTVARVVEFVEGLLPPPPWKRAGALGPTTIELAWEAVPGASTYELWRFEPGRPPLRLYAGPNLSFTDHADPDRSYYYAVRAAGGAFGAFRKITTGPRPCLEIEKAFPAKGQLLLRGNSQWWEVEPGAFRLLPGEERPIAALGNGPICALYFDRPLPAGACTLLVDTLLTDEYGRFLVPACATLPFTISPDTVTPCILPLRWEITADTLVEIIFSALTDPAAENPASYRLFPTGRVIRIERLSENRLRLALSVSPRRRPLSLSWGWGDTLCPRSIAFHPLNQSLNSWGFFPNPVRNHPEIRFWGLPPETTISILSPSGSLCTRLRITATEIFPAWNLRTLSGQRIEPGIYIVLVEHEEERAWEKLYVEE